MLPDRRGHASRLVLVVDDDEDVRETLLDALLFEGYAVESATNGHEGLEWLRAHAGTPCVVVLDMMMPVMNGQAFLDCKATDPTLARVPVVVLTAGGDCRELLASGKVRRCLPKTASLKELMIAIESAD